MKRIFWVRGQRRFYGICWLVVLIVILPVLNLVELVSPSLPLVQFLFVDLICLCLIGSIVLEVFVQRVVVEPWGIRAYDMLNRAKPPLPFEQITNYARTPSGDWVVAEGDTVYRLPRIDKQQFHAVMAEFAPKALHAKLWNCGQLPPAQDFTGLSAFDFNLWLINLAGAVVLSFAFSLFAHFFAIFYFVSSFLQISYDLRNLFARLSLTAEGISVQWPFKTNAIPWEEITAVFCERNSSRWTYFVVTAPGRSITIPTHVLADPEVRRKFFYNIPDQTRCVNFDKMRFRGRGRGKKIFSAEEGYSLEPQFNV